MKNKQKIRTLYEQKIGRPHEKKCWEIPKLIIIGLQQTQGNPEDAFEDDAGIAS